LAKKPLLTDDAHLHDKSAEHVYRTHHAQDVTTGEPLRGVAEVAEDECGCAHCVAHVEGDAAVLAEAKEAHKEGVKRAKTSKRRK
jgi:hypothetical protein